MVVGELLVAMCNAELIQTQTFPPDEKMRVEIKVLWDEGRFRHNTWPIGRSAV